MIKYEFFFLLLNEIISREAKVSHCRRMDKEAFIHFIGGALGGTAGTAITCPLEVVTILNFPGAKHQSGGGEGRGAW